MQAAKAVYCMAPKLPLVPGPAPSRRCVTHWAACHRVSKTPPEHRALQPVHTPCSRDTQDPFLRPAPLHTSVALQGCRSCWILSLSTRKTLLSFQSILQGCSLGFARPCSLVLAHQGAWESTAGGHICSPMSSWGPMKYPQKDLSCCLWRSQLQVLLSWLC